MKLVCSRGHEFDTSRPLHRHLRVGDRCPMEMSYDRLDGSTYCRRILKAPKVGLRISLERR